ncbi:MAG: tetratricopeptide repeat protein [Candidatus Delongbacteria bacterium]|nr:tetratricopeptide repeat protein [Candidatus Delongbacteria bacterium]
MIGTTAGRAVCLLLLIFLNYSVGYAVDYADGIAAFNAGDYNDAIAVFNELLQESPPRDLLDNIHFWLGESRFARGDLLAALYHFEQVFTFSNANKRDDALLKIALCYRELELQRNACATLHSLDHLYHTPEAQAKRQRVRNRYCLDLSE